MIKHFLYLSVITILSGCAGASRSVSTRPSLSNNNNNDVISNIVVHPLFEIFHVNDSTSELYFNIKSNELLYTRRDGNDFTANALLHYELYESYSSSSILDSATIRISDNNNSENLLVGNVPVKIKTGQKGILKIFIKDLNRSAVTLNTVEIDKQNDLVRQNFIITSITSGVPVFKNYITTNDTIHIQYRYKKQQKLFVSYYNKKFEIAPPAYSPNTSSVINYKPDSLFTIDLDDKGFTKFNPTKKGFYHFQTDTSQPEGLTIFIFSGSFPEIKKTEELLYPLRYITSQEEFENLEKSNELKLDIENFWLAVANNDKEKARNIIRKYYTRVQKANEKFTSHTEGWKTDRGMIYLIYGKPNSVYKNDSYESWVYLEEGSLSSLSFSFIKVKNPFTNNDYVLERSAAYKQSWINAVDVWRQGRAYYIEE